MPYQIVVKHFEELSTIQLYALLQLRNQVFVVEQNCVFLDIDGKDTQCHHLLFFDKNNVLAAYSRLLPAGLAYNEVSIGRVVTSPQHRGTGIGRLLMQSSIEHCLQLYPTQAIRIGAQQHLEKFYQNFGFATTSEPYLEDGIWHIEMLRQ